MSSFQSLFRKAVPIIGMIHVQALPATPAARYTPVEIVEMAIREAEVYRDAGFDGIMIENMHDLPYLKRQVGPEITAMMAVVGREVKQTSGLLCGMQILAGANREAMAAALAAGMDFVRAEGFVFGHLADEGYIDSDAGSLLRYRKQIGADEILIFTDVKKKHSSHALTADMDIAETAKAAAFFKSDGIIVTGLATGMAADVEDIRTVKSNVDIPVLIGSGVTLDNVQTYFEAADALIVGSWLKKEGFWENEPDRERARKLMDKVNELRQYSS